MSRVTCYYLPTHAPSVAAHTSSLSAMQVEVVSSLLRGNNVNLNALDRLQNTALDDALREGHDRIAQMLKLAGGACYTAASSLSHVCRDC